MAVCRKPGGTADAVDERTPASFSAKAFENASAVSSSEFGGFSFFCRRTDFRCRHNFFGSPQLSVIFLSQNSHCFCPYNRCFFCACVEANRSLNEMNNQPSPSITLFKRSCPTLGCGAIRVEPRCCWLMATACCTTGSVLVEERAESGVVHLLKFVDWGAIVFGRIAQIWSPELASKAVLVETLPGTRADMLLNIYFVRGAVPHRTFDLIY